MRRILHIDMDAFFAAVELLRHPELRGRPLVVGGRGDPLARGVVSTASYEARRYGVHSAMPLRTAYRLCPQCVFMPVDFPAYLKISELIKSILKEYSSRMEEAGVDEAYLDVSAASKDPVEIARQIKAQVRRETGLTCSIGIGPNKLLAKLASDLEKPDGLVVLTEQDIQSRIWPLPVHRLLGVGPKTAARLWRELGVRTVGDLAAVPESALVEQFGPVRGHYLHQTANGIDDSSLVTYWEAKTLGHETTFQRDTDDWVAIGKTLDVLAEGLVARLSNKGTLAGSVTVKLRYADFETHVHTLRLPFPTDDSVNLSEAARSVLSRFERLKKVRLVGLRFGELRRASTD